MVRCESRPSTIGHITLGTKQQVRPVREIRTLGATGNIQSGVMGAPDREAACEHYVAHLQRDQTESRDQGELQPHRLPSG
jgi:hypothetical protein